MSGPSEMPRSRQPAASVRRAGERRRRRAAPARVAALQVLGGIRYVPYQDPAGRGLLSEPACGAQSRSHRSDRRRDARAVAIRHPNGRHLSADFTDAAKRPCAGGTLPGVFVRPDSRASPEAGWHFTIFQWLGPNAAAELQARRRAAFASFALQPGNRRKTLHFTPTPLQPCRSSYCVPLFFHCGLILARGLLGTPSAGFRPGKIRRKPRHKGGERRAE